MRKTAETHAAQIDLVRPSLNTHASGPQSARRGAWRSDVHLEAEDLMIELIGQTIRVDQIGTGLGKLLRQRQMTVRTERGVLMHEAVEVAADDDHMQLLRHLNLIVPDRLGFARFLHPEIEMLAQWPAGDGGDLQAAFRLSILPLQRELPFEGLCVNAGNRAEKKDQTKYAGRLHRLSR